MKLKLLSFLLLFSVNINYALNTFKISNNYSVIFNLPITTATLTTTVSSTYTSAQLGGNITSDGGATVTERGVVYSLTTNPTTANTKVVIGSGTGAFSQAVTGLTTSTTYYVRAYAINSQGTSYGSELSFTTAAFCGGNIIGSGYGTNPIQEMALDNNWKIVTLPQGYSYSETLPYNAYVPQTNSLAPVYLYIDGYTVSGSTYYWIAPKSDASALIGEGANYNWIVQQTFNVAQSGFYDLNFSGMGDNAISFYINGVIDTTDPVKPTITGGTQIGTRFDSFTSMGTFSGVTYLNAGVNTASMVMEDWGGATTALISGSTFTCNTSYINVNPTISSISDISIVEGATPSPIAFIINDQETPLNNLTVTASSSNTALIPNNNITLQGNTGSRTLSLTPVSGELGTSTITITLDDNSGGLVTKTFVVTMNPLVLNRYGKLVPDVLQAINIHGAEGVGSGQNKFGKSVDKPLPKDGLTSIKAALSVLDIKQEFPSSTDGVYWITNPNINSGTPFQVYADMTTDGGGWTLLNVGGNSSTSLEVSSLTSPSSKGYLPRTTVIGLANNCTTVQLRAGNSYSSYANKTTSTDPLAIGALRSSSTVAGGSGTWHNGSLTTSIFTTDSGSWCWDNCCVPYVTGWPQMYHSNNYGSCVHWYVDTNMGRQSTSPDAWFSTWIR